MYFDTQIEHEFDVMNEFIESEMHKLRDKVMLKLNSVFAHPAVSIRNVLLSIAYAYFDNYEDAEIVAQQLELGKLEFLAVKEDFEAFKEIYLTELELAQNF